MRAILISTLLVFYCSAGADDLFLNGLVNAAIDRTKQTVEYNGAYYAIGYPGGDVPANIGVCTDVLIRSYRRVGVDLQKEVHEDIIANFGAYPSKRIWGLSRPDTNIDHRRVPNLQVFFERKGEILPVTGNASDYQAGEIVTWMLPGNLPHIGVVTSQKSVGSERPLIVHNIGSGPRLEDMLFDYDITGHYRYAPEIDKGASKN